MADNTVKITLELPKAFHQQVLSRKPAWLTWTEEQFFARMLAQGNFDDFFQQFSECEEKMIETQKEYREKMKQIGQKLGVPIDPLQEIRRKPVKAPAKAPAKPAGSGVPADNPALSAEKPSSTSKI